MRNFTGNPRNKRGNEKAYPHFFDNCSVSENCIRRRSGAALPPALGKLSGVRIALGNALRKGKNCPIQSLRYGNFLVRGNPYLFAQIFCGYRPLHKKRIEGLGRILFERRKRRNARLVFKNLPSPRRS